MSGENRGRILFVFTESLKSLLIYFLSAWLFFDSVYGLIPLLPYAVFSIYRVARKTGQRQRELVTVQFKDVLGCMLTALEAGYSAEKSVESARTDMAILHGNKAYMVKELEKMERRLGLGENLEDIFMEFASYTGIREIENFADVFVVAKRSGGDIISLIRSANRDLYEKIEMKREVEGVIASVVSESTVMKFMPLLIIFYMKVFSAPLISVLYETALGRIVMSLTALLYFCFAEYTERLVDGAGR